VRRSRTKTRAKSAKKTSKPRKRPAKKRQARTGTQKKTAKKQKRSLKKVRKKIRKAPRKRPQKKKPATPSKKVRKRLQEKEIGRITHHFAKISVGIIKLKGELKVGDRIHIKGAHDDFTQQIKSMQFNHNDISVGRRGMEIGIKATQRVHENDKVYKVLP